MIFRRKSKAAQAPPAINVLPQAPEPEPTSFFGRWRHMFSTIALFILAPLAALAIAAFVVQSYQVDGMSMEPTLQNNDRLIVDKIPRTWARITGHGYVPPRGTIIIFNQNLDLGAGFGVKQLVKRVVGLPGDHVVVDNGVLNIYNKQNPNGFRPDQVGHYKINIPTDGKYDVVLGKDEVFVCGDNRPHSEDSRVFGPIQVNNIIGKLSFRILPVSKFKHY